MSNLSTTTFSQAVSANAGAVHLASGTGVTLGSVLWADREALIVTGTIPGTSTTFQVQRGRLGSPASTHVSGATVYLGSSNDFYAEDPVGVPESPPVVTPWINTVTGTLWEVSGSTWVETSGGGVAEGDVVGPSSATTGNVASYVGTTGKILADSGKLASAVVTGPTSVADNAIARFDATTGKLLQTGGITIADGQTGTLSGTNTGDQAVSVGGSAAYIVSTTGVQTLVAAAALTRYAIIVAQVVTTFADGDGAQPTFSIGETGTATKYAPTSAFTGATAGTTTVYAGTLTSGAALIVTAVAGTGATETGALTITAIVSP